MAVSTNHNKQVDVLKGMAMLCVLITHFRWPEQYRLIPVFPFIIEMAVPLFMVLSGYTWTLSYRKNGDSVLELYSPEHLVKKILRFTIPYIPIIIIETYFCGEHMGGGILDFVTMFITGGSGPGGYYYPVMIQLIFIFPLIYLLIKKLNVGGFILCIIINALYDVLRVFYHIQGDAYRILMFRFIMVIGFGCLLALNQQSQIEKKFLIGAEIIGGISIVSVHYLNCLSIEYSISFICALFILPWAYILLNSNINSKILGLIGKASYNIYLLQMLYYWKVNGYIGKYFSNLWVWFIGGIMICCLVGIFYWIIEKKFTSLVLKYVTTFFDNHKNNGFVNGFNKIFFIE